MKMLKVDVDNTYARAQIELTNLYNFFNAISFDNKLEGCTITIQKDKGSYGHISVGKIWGGMKREINLSAYYLDREIDEVAATLLHEMTHEYNMLMDIQDTSRNGYWHNENFKIEAEKHFLKITKHDKYGWTITEPTAELREWLLKYEVTQGIWIAVKDFRIATSDDNKPKNDDDKGTGTSTDKGKKINWKHTCPTCKCNARTTKDITLICGQCKVEMLKN